MELCRCMGVIAIGVLGLIGGAGKSRYQSHAGLDVRRGDA